MDNETLLIAAFNNNSVVLRKVISVSYDPENLTKTFVTKRIESWSSIKEFFNKQSTGLSDYLFDEVERANQETQYYKNKAITSLSVSDQLKLENALLKRSVEELERRLEKAKANTEVITGK